MKLSFNCSKHLVGLQCNVFILLIVPFFLHIHYISVGIILYHLVYIFVCTLNKYVIEDHMVDFEANCILSLNTV